eukprot:1649824-Alexandrium_andersonii.AAC.1
MDRSAGQCCHRRCGREGSRLEMGGERPGRLRSGRSHAVARPGTGSGGWPPTASAAIATGHGRRPPRQRRGRPASGRRR